MSETNPVVCEKHGNLFLTRGLTMVYCGLCRKLAQYERAKVARAKEQKQ